MAETTTPTTTPTINAITTAFSMERFITMASPPETPPATPPDVPTIKANRCLLFTNALSLCISNVKVEVPTERQRRWSLQRLVGTMVLADQQFHQLCGAGLHSCRQDLASVLLGKHHGLLVPLIRLPPFL